jgi:hypothetical protein
MARPTTRINDAARAADADHRRSDLRRLGLGVGDGDDEALRAHRRQHHRGRGHLRKRAERRPAQIVEGERGLIETGRGQKAEEEEDRERQAEQEPHLRRADGAERPDEFALHRVAQRLRARREERNQDPEAATRHFRELRLRLLERFSVRLNRHCEDPEHEPRGTKQSNSRRRSGSGLLRLRLAMTVVSARLRTSRLDVLHRAIDASGACG